MWKSPRLCEHEADIVEMARSNSDAPALRTHAQSCAVCRETLATAAWMHELAALPVEAPPLPDPIYLWLRGELFRRWDAQRSAMTPIDVGERIQVGVGLACATALLGWLWSRLQALHPSTVPPSGITVMLIVGAILLVGAASIVARDLWDGNERNERKWE